MLLASGSHMPLDTCPPSFHMPLNSPRGRVLPPKPPDCINETAFGQHVRIHAAVPTPLV